MVCSNFHSTRVCKLCLFLFAQFIVPYLALIDANGTQVVEYGYDAWSNPISKSGSMVAMLGTENLFRYREYVYDEETKLYYNKECGIDGEKSLNEVKGELK